MEKTNIIENYKEKGVQLDKKQNKILENAKSNTELNCSISTNCSNCNINTENSFNYLNNAININENTKSLSEKDIKMKENKKYNYLFNEEYLDEIYMNLILDEKNAKIKIEKKYMKKQKNINDKMRAILVDWIIEVHHHFHLKRKTLFQTILIIDLYLSFKIIDKVNFQLLGLSSLLISIKENENYSIKLEEFIKLTDNAYTKRELLIMEMNILKTLKFEILAPTSDEFYNILSKTFNFNKIQHHLGEYFIDSSLLDYNMLKYKASTIAIACAYIVMKFYKLNGYKELYTSNIISWDSSQKIIKECAKDLCYLVKDLSKSLLKGTKDKYSSEEYDKVAFLCEDQ